jgi:hypothetical protein
MPPNGSRSVANGMRELLNGEGSGYSAAHTRPMVIRTIRGLCRAQECRNRGSLHRSGIAVHIYRGNVGETGAEVDELSQLQFQQGFEMIVKILKFNWGLTGKNGHSFPRVADVQRLLAELLVFSEPAA